MQLYEELRKHILEIIILVNYHLNMQSKTIKHFLHLLNSNLASNLNLIWLFDSI